MLSLSEPNELNFSQYFLLKNRYHSSLHYNFCIFKFLRSAFSTLFGGLADRSDCIINDDDFSRSRFQMTGLNVSIVRTGSSMVDDVTLRSRLQTQVEAHRAVRRVGTISMMNVSSATSGTQRSPLNPVSEFERVQSAAPICSLTNPHCFVDTHRTRASLSDAGEGTCANHNECSRGMEKS